MGFNALVVDRDADGRTHAGVREIALDDLPAGEVTVAVDYSTVNYKDGLCLGPGAGLVRRYPHVPGVDFAGRVEASSDPRYRPGRRGGADRLAGRRGALGRLRAEGAGQGATGWCRCPTG